MTKVRITIIGDRNVGKTALVSTYLQSRFPTDTFTTGYGQFNISVFSYQQKLDDEASVPILEFHDTSGQEDYYDRIKPLPYRGTDCFLVCFSVDKANSSYSNIKTKWIPELKNFAPNASRVLVGTKIDLRKEPNKKCFTKEDGIKLQKKIQADAYKECSVKNNGEGIKELIEDVIQIVKVRKAKRANNKKNCTML